MDVKAFLSEIRRDPEYADQIVHVREVPGRPARKDTAVGDLDPFVRTVLPDLGIDALYSH